MKFETEADWLAARQAGLPISTSAKSLADAFIARLAKSLLTRTKYEPVKGCWLWTGMRKNYGYGVVRICGRLYRVHRLAAMLWLDFDYFSEELIIHSCDVTNCINPSHIRAGSPADNNADMGLRGRRGRLRGTAHPMAKLADEDIRTIRLKAAAGQNQRDLAREYSVTQSNIGRIVRKENWKHL